MSSPIIRYCNGPFCGKSNRLAEELLEVGYANVRRHQLGAPVWRALQRIATSYFWMVFVITGIEHLYGPHRPDDWYGFSLLTLTAALLIRFADSFVQHRRYRLAGKVA